MKIFPKIPLCLLTWLAFFALAPWAFPLAQGRSEPISLEGRVVNGTSGRQAVEGLEVRLYQYDGQKVLELGRTKTKKDGAFLFSEVRPEPSLLYYAMAEYKGVFYFSDAFHLTDKNPPQVELSVFETTDQDGAIKVKVHHIVFEPSDSSLWVREFMVFENQGTRTFVGDGSVTTEDGQKGVVAIALPSGAVDLRFEGESLSSVIRTQQGFISTTKLRPGMTNLGFSYRLDLGRSGLLFKRKLSMNTESVELIFPTKGIQVTTPQPQFQNPNMDSEERFLRLSGKNFDKGFQLAVEVAIEQKRDSLKWIFGIIGILVFLAGLGISLLRGRKKPDVALPGPDEKEALDPADEREALLEKLASLDLAHEEGGLDSKTYEQERTKLLDAVKGLARGSAEQENRK